MRQAALALLLFTTGVAAQPASPPTTPGPNPLAPLDRTEPSNERRRLEKGTPEERSRVLARAAATSHERDESLALLVLAAERARTLELGANDLLLVARGLAARTRTKMARDALFALLSAPSRDGFDGTSLPQRIAATALARAADSADPEPTEAPVDPRSSAPLTPAKPRPDTLGRLLELAEEPRLEATVTQALRRYPPTKPPPAPTGPAFFRVGSALGDLRWVPAIDQALLADRTPEPVLLAALRAATDLSDARMLPRIGVLARSSRAPLAIAALEAWASLEPRTGIPSVERALTAPGITPAHLELARFVRNPNLLRSIAERVGGTPPTTESLRLLGRLPQGAGIPALARLAARDESMHTAIDALEHAPGEAADDALALLLRDARPVARHEAAHALLARAVLPEPSAQRARVALERARSQRVPLPSLVQSWLSGRPTARAAAATALVAGVHDDSTRSLAARAECARALRLESPACAFAFGRALPRTLDDAARAHLTDLLAIEDASVRGELLEGVARGAWPGRGPLVAQALERATDLPLRRRLAALAARLGREDSVDAAVLARTTAALRMAEPDLRTARLLDGRTERLSPGVHLVRADADGVLRCGYARDERGAVVPFVLEDGAALVEGVVGTTLEATFTRCDDSVLSARPMR